MKRGLGDLAKSYETLHSKCGTGDPDACACAYCVDGACKRQSPYASYETFEGVVLCALGQGETNHKYECAMGLCADCGVYQLAEVELLRT